MSSRVKSRKVDSNACYLQRKYNFKVSYYNFSDVLTISTIVLTFCEIVADRKYHLKC